MASKIRHRLTVEIDPELLEFVEKGIRKKVFANKSHAMNLALYQLKQTRIDV